MNGWHPEQDHPLGAPLLRVDYVHADRTARLYLPAGCTATFDGVLEFVVTRFPDARGIETFAGDVADACYRRDPHERRRWHLDVPPSRGAHVHEADAAARSLIQRARDC